MVVILTTVALCAIVRTFAVLSGKPIAEGLLQELAPNALSGAMRPSLLLQKLDLDWSKFLEHTPRWIRNELERMDKSHEEPASFVVDFCATALSQTPPAVTAIDRAEVHTIDDAKALVLKRSPAAVFTKEWRQLGESSDAVGPGWSLDVYATETDLANDPEGKQPFASILARGSSPPPSADGRQAGGKAMGTSLPAAAS